MQKLSKSQPEQIKKTLPRDTRMKLQKNNDKEKILKASKGKKKTTLCREEQR